MPQNGSNTQKIRYLLLWLSVFDPKPRVSLAKLVDRARAAEGYQLFRFSVRSTITKCVGSSKRARYFVELLQGIDL
jgi:hypothetical protein